MRRERSWRPSGGPGPMQLARGSSGASRFCRVGRSAPYARPLRTSIQQSPSGTAVAAPRSSIPYRARGPRSRPPERDARPARYTVRAAPGAPRGGARGAGGDVTVTVTDRVRRAILNYVLVAHFFADNIYTWPPLAPWCPPWWMVCESRCAGAHSPPTRPRRAGRRHDDGTPPAPCGIACGSTGGDGKPN